MEMLALGVKLFLPLRDGFAILPWAGVPGPAGLTSAPALEGNQLSKAAITLSSLPHWD